LEVPARAEETDPDPILMDIRTKDETDGIETAMRLVARWDFTIICVATSVSQPALPRRRSSDKTGRICG